MDHDNGQFSQLDTLPTLLAKLRDALSLYKQFQPVLVLPESEDGGEVTFSMRDSSAHILRCLKVWYDLPSDVFFCAVNLMDRFLAKMKVQPKHMTCITTASFHLACKITHTRVPDAADLITISQCNYTLSDLLRMELVIANKLAINNAPNEPLAPITPLTFLRIFHKIFSILDVNYVYKRAINEFELCQRLEIVSCDGSCANYKACEIALVFLCSELNIGVARLFPPPCSTCLDVLSVVAFINEIQHTADISDSNLFNCLEHVTRVVSQYNAQAVIPHKQRLIWRLSRRTLRDLRPTNKLASTLPTIEEQGHARMDADS